MAQKQHSQKNKSTKERIVMDGETPSGKVLFTSHTANFSKFNRPFMRWFSEQGYEVHYASAGEEGVLDCDKHFKVNFNRSPWSFENICAYNQLKKILDREGYALIHTHTPVGGVVTRLAARDARKKGAKVMYTAHGFHFYAGAPIKNWVLYYPMEKLLSRTMDILVTINSEDHARAVSRLKPLRSESMKGVGVDLEQFVPITDSERSAMRKKLGFSKKDRLLLCVAEFTSNKDQAFLIDAAARIPGVKLVLAGKGQLLEACKRRAEQLNIADRVMFLGYRKDIADVYALADILVSASGREGLPVNVIEAMARGLPVICTEVRGHTDLIKDGRNGFLYKPKDMPAFTRAVQELLGDYSMSARMAENNIVDAAGYSWERVSEKMEGIYESLLSAEEARS